MHGDSVLITIEIPAVLAGTDTASRARRLLALDAVRLGRITWRTAARELGLSSSAFLDLAREQGIPVARYEMNDWLGERATVERLGRTPQE